MAITRRPKATAQAKPAVDVDALINRGGGVAADVNASADHETKPVGVMLRVPAATLAQVDRALRERRVRIPRHTWLLEAIIEKLERESGISN